MLSLSMIIALLGEAKDPQIRHLHHHLLLAGHTPWVADTSRFGTDWSLSFDANSFEGHFAINDKRILLSQVRAAYWHRYTQPTLSDSPCRSMAMDFSSALNCWFYYSATRWVNGLEAVRYHQCKPAQLHQASQLGALIPQTWIGNNVHAASAFSKKLTAPIVKPVHGGDTASRLESDDESNIATRLTRSPATLQAFIPGTNIRTYVIGNEVFHFLLNTSCIDFRADNQVEPEITTAPAELTRLATKLCRALGMHWCAIDWRLTPDKQYYFLEANPCPYFLYVEQVTGVDITRALIAALTQSS